MASFVPLVLATNTNSLAKLEGSRYGNTEDINEMLEHFETSAKPGFADDSERSYIKFGTRRDTDAKVGIHRGQLALEG